MWTLFFCLALTVATTSWSNLPSDMKHLILHQADFPTAIALMQTNKEMAASWKFFSYNIEKACSRNLREQSDIYFLLRFRVLVMDMGVGGVECSRAVAQNCRKNFLPGQSGREYQLKLLSIRLNERNTIQELDELAAVIKACWVETVIIHVPLYFRALALNHELWTAAFSAIRDIMFIAAANPFGQVAVPENKLLEFFAHWLASGSRGNIRYICIENLKVSNSFLKNFDNNSLPNLQSFYMANVIFGADMQQIRIKNLIKKLSEFRRLESIEIHSDDCELWEDKSLRSFKQIKRFRFFVPMTEELSLKLFQDLPYFVRLQELAIVLKVTSWAVFLRIAEYLNSRALTSLIIKIWPEDHALFLETTIGVDMLTSKSSALSHLKHYDVEILGSVEFTDSILKMIFHSVGKSSFESFSFIGFFVTRTLSLFQTLLVVLDNDSLVSLYLQGFSRNAEFVWSLMPEEALLTAFLIAKSKITRIYIGGTLNNEILISFINILVPDKLIRLTSQINI